MVFRQGFYCTFQEGSEPSNSLSSLPGTSGRLEREGEEDQQKTTALQPSNTVSEWIFIGAGIIVEIFQREVTECWSVEAWKRCRRTPLSWSVQNFKVLPSIPSGPEHIFILKRLESVIGRVSEGASENVRSAVFFGFVLFSLGVPLHIPRRGRSLSTASAVCRILRVLCKGEAKKINRRLRPCSLATLLR